MVDQRGELNDAQLRTLRWIADGCPDGVMLGYSHKVSARALQHRRLVKIRQRSGLWSAEITDAGAACLERFADRLAVDQGEAKTQSGDGRKSSSQTDRLIEALLANDNRMEINGSDRERYERLGGIAGRYKKAPEGMRVVVRYEREAGKTFVVLEPLPVWMMENLEPIEVLSTLRQPSDVVVELREREDLRIAPAEKGRALRLIDALVREARRRGHAVSATKGPRTDRWGYLDSEESGGGHVEFRIGGDRYRIEVSQERVRTPHVPTTAEQERAKKGYAYVPAFDEAITPHLRMTIEGNEAVFRRAYWSEKQGTGLESALAEILREMELRAERAEENRREAEREREARRRRWATARAAAVEELIRADRAEVLRAQVGDWEFAIRVQRYLLVMEARIKELGDPGERAEAEVWLRWASEYAERMTRFTPGSRYQRRRRQSRKRSSRS